MSGHLQPTDFSLPTELSPSPEPASPAAADNAEAPSTNGEAPPTRRAQLVMGPPLGGEPDDGGSGLNEEVTPHQEMQNNAQLLAGLEDDAMDLELTHARIRTLRGVGIERFRNVETISLRQNLLSTLSYKPHPPVEEHEVHSVGVVTANGAEVDPADEDSHDDEDAKKKEDEFEYMANGDGQEVVWPLRGLAKLELLDLYDNRIKRVDGLEHLPSLTSLDLSFNLLRSVAPFNNDSPDSPYAYPLLDHLYLIQNKLSKIEGVRHRTGLVYIEFGGNRIRTIENLPISPNLRSLFLGKNKITKIEGLDGLVNLKRLSIQSNRVTKIEGLDSLVNLEELYLLHNGLTKVEGLTHNINLTTLDVANNQIEALPAEELATLTKLDEIWANNNLIAALPILPPSTHPNLETIYLEALVVRGLFARLTLILLHGLVRDGEILRYEPSVIEASQLQPQVTGGSCAFV